METTPLKAIRAKRLGGELVRTYPCLTAAAIDVRVSSGKASECANGKRDAVNGYVFKWAANPQER